MSTPKPRLQIMSAPEMPPVKERHPTALAMTQALRRHGLLDGGSRRSVAHREQQVSARFHILLSQGDQTRPFPVPTLTETRGYAMPTALRVAMPIPQSHLAYEATEALKSRGILSLPVSQSEAEAFWVKVRAALETAVVAPELYPPDADLGEVPKDAPPPPVHVERHPMAIAITEALSRHWRLEGGSAKQDAQCKVEVRGVIHRLYEGPFTTVDADMVVSKLKLLQVLDHRMPDQHDWRDIKNIVSTVLAEGPDNYLPAGEPVVEPPAASETPVPTPDAPPAVNPWFEVADRAKALASAARRQTARALLSLSNHIWALAGLVGGKDIGR